MVERVHIVIAEELARRNDNESESRALRALQEIANDYLWSYASSESSNSDNRLEKARADLSSIIHINNNQYTENGKNPLNEQAIAKNNHNLHVGIQKYGFDYVGFLLPTTCHHYAAIVNILERETSVFTKTALIDLDIENHAIRGIGKDGIRFQILKAMQNVAIAEKDYLSTQTA